MARNPGGFLMMLYPTGLPEPPTTQEAGQVAAVLAACFTCEIHLVADRVASLRTGSTHKIYQGWRFEATIPAGQGQRRTTLLSVMVDPAHLAASQSRYAMVQLPDQGAIAAGGSSAFSWSAKVMGMSDPFAAAQGQLCRQLEAAGWRQDAMAPKRFTNSGPVTPGGEAALSSVELDAHLVVSEEAAGPGTSEPDSPSKAMPSRPRISGLDGWAMDGCRCSAGIEGASSHGLPPHRGEAT